MIVARDAATLRRALRARATPCGFVPTMGCLHAGHEALLARARGGCATAVASIFVNPLQFSPGEDYDRYPRTLDADLTLCAARGMDIVFAPEPAAVLPHPPLTEVRVPALAEALCGPFRPGHFDGVALIVTKLLNLVGPDRLYLGEKDAQQVAIVRRLVADLDMDVEVVACPTVREPDGLALSSRNAYLSAEQRRQAAVLYRALREVADAVEGGQRDSARLIADARERIAAAGPCRIDYVAIVDPGTLLAVPVITQAALVAAAVHIGACRLIDNLQLTAVPRAAAAESDHAT